MSSSGGSSSSRHRAVACHRRGGASRAPGPPRRRSPTVPRANHKCLSQQATDDRQNSRRVGRRGAAARELHPPDLARPSLGADRARRTRPLDRRLRTADSSEALHVGPALLQRQEQVARSSGRECRRRRGPVTASGRGSGAAPSCRPAASAQLADHRGAPALTETRTVTGPRAIRVVSARTATDVHRVRRSSCRTSGRSRRSRDRHGRLRHEIAVDRQVAGGNRRAVRHRQRQRARRRILRRPAQEQLLRPRARLGLEPWRTRGRRRRHRRCRGRVAVCAAAGPAASSHRSVQNPRTCRRVSSNMEVPPLPCRYGTIPAPDGKHLASAAPPW